MFQVGVGVVGWGSKVMVVLRKVVLMHGVFSSPSQLPPAFSPHPTDSGGDGAGALASRDPAPRQGGRVREPDCAADQGGERSGGAQEEVRSVVRGGGWGVSAPEGAAPNTQRTTNN